MATFQSRTPADEIRRSEAEIEQVGGHATIPEAAEILNVSPPLRREADRRGEARRRVGSAGLARRADGVPAAER